MIDLTTFAMQIIENDPEGIKICQVDGSSLVTVVVPRQLLAKAKDLPDVPGRGVYYLLRVEGGRLRRVYAGKTLNGIRRLDDHNSQKDRWNLAVRDRERPFLIAACWHGACAAVRAARHGWAGAKMTNSS